ncbi:MAG: OmpH family outer membrane protein [Prolixibacteraceae bacterium]|nr:OmpH family outer membrane protein [Prolixibacteraceae bacterium]
MKKFSTIILFLCIVIPSFSQETLKIGHLNVPEVIRQLPETDSIRAIIQKETGDLEQMYTELIAEYDKMYDAYDKEKAGLSDFIRQQKENEIREKAAKVQQFNSDANQRIEKLSVELQQPVYKKVQEAINSVATREQFTYVLDISNGVLVYQSPNSLDITPLVLKELGINEGNN